MRLYLLTYQWLFEKLIEIVATKITKGYSTKISILKVLKGLQWKVD